MKRIEDLLGMSVVTVEEGVRLGKLEGVEIDPAGGRVAYLRFSGEGKRPDGLIPWEAVRSIGTDVVTIESARAAREGVAPPEQGALTAYVGDRPVVTESGKRLGTVSSYDVDERTGAITGYRVGGGGILGRLKGNELEFPHSAIRTFGKDAIIVSDEVAPAEAA